MNGKDKLVVDQNTCENYLNMKSNCVFNKNYKNKINDELLVSGKNIELPTGILYDIRSNENTIFKKDSVFKYIHDNPKSMLIPTSYMDNYVTEFNFNGQTPLMYSVLINNLIFVKTLLRYDVGKVDDFNKSALDYAYEFNKQSENLNCHEVKSLHDIIQILEEYEYHDKYDKI